MNDVTSCVLITNRHQFGKFMNAVTVNYIQLSSVTKFTVKYASWALKGVEARKSVTKRKTELPDPTQLLWQTVLGRVR